MKTKRVASGPYCTTCLNYYITWDPVKPYGCRALGFKSRILPIRIVRQSTPGMNCQWFSRQRNKRRTS